MKSSLLRRFVVLVSMALGSALFLACEDDLVKDATFRMWCGEDRLCAWNVESGRIRRAPTWHKNDPGVELLDTPTAISQVVDKSARCLEFTTIADVEAGAQVTVTLDFDDDGTVEFEQQIAAVGFREVKTEVTAPSHAKFKIAITKKGSGRAVLAMLRVQAGSKCTAPAIRRRDQLLGAACRQGEPSECRSGVCCEGVCAECCDKPEFFDISEDGGVATPPPVACPGGAACVRRDVPQDTFIISAVPKQCDPGMRLRPPGAVCIADDDCASEVCEGAIAESHKPDFSAGAGATTPCTGDFPDAGGADCRFFRVREGRCR